MCFLYCSSVLGLCIVILYSQYRVVTFDKIALISSICILWVVLFVSLTIVNLKYSDWCQSLTITDIYVLWYCFEETARHRQQVLLPLHSESALYTPKWIFSRAMMSFSRITKLAVDYQRIESKTHTGNKYCCHCIANVHFIHHSEFSNRVPSMQYTHRVSVIWLPQIRGFFAVESSRTIGSWCL